MSRKQLHRRTFLKGVAATGAATIGLPLLEAMVSSRGLVRQAHAQDGDQPPRLIIFHFPNGCHLPSLIPTEAGRDYTMPPLLQSLAPHRDDFNILSGLSTDRIHTRGAQHGVPQAALLTGFTPDEENQLTQGPSLDEIVGEAWAGEAPFRVMRTTLIQHDGLDTFHNNLCYGASGSAIPCETSPARLFDSMFRPYQDGTSGRNTANVRRQSVLDLVREDADRLRRQCGVGDRRLLDEHLQSVRELEQSIGFSTECSIDPAVEQMATQATDYDARADTFIRLAALALRCDLTRVAAISMGHSRNEISYGFLGEEQDDHQLSHYLISQMNQGQNITAQDAVDRFNLVTEWKLQKLALLFEELKRPDATGATLLDNSILLGVSEHGNIHNTSMLPVIVGGKLGQMSDPNRRGQHIVYPCSTNTMLYHRAEPIVTADHCLDDSPPQNTPFSNLLSTILEALQIDHPGFEDQSGTLDRLWI